jgi:hypothetical protein
MDKIREAYLENSKNSKSSKHSDPQLLAAMKAAKAEVIDCPAGAPGCIVISNCRLHGQGYNYIFHTFIWPANLISKLNIFRHIIVPQLGAHAQEKIHICSAYFVFILIRNVKSLN